MSGTEDISAFVYGCCGSLSTFCFSPHSMILPAYMTYTYSARYATTAMLCVIRSMLIPCFSWRPRSRLRIWAWTDTSSAEVGSSRIKSFGLVEMARAMATRCNFDGATYVEHVGEVELLPGIRLLPAPGHTDGHQVVVVETDAGTNVLGGDVSVSFRELGGGTTEGQRRVLALEALTWLSHAPEPKIPQRRP